MSPSERALLLAVAENELARIISSPEPIYIVEARANSLSLRIAAVRAEAAKAENSGEWAK